MASSKESGCPNCGASRRPAAKFCFNCGAPLGATAAQAPPTAFIRALGPLPIQTEPGGVQAWAGAAIGGLAGGTFWYAVFRDYGPIVVLGLAPLLTGAVAGYLTSLLAGAPGVATRVAGAAGAFFAIVIRDLLLISQARGLRLGLFIEAFVMTPRYFLPLIIAIGVAVVVGGFRAWTPRWNWRAA
ncbi:MAG: zinc ribbon domain-containing protein [Actinomycetota bacterium]